MPAFVTFGRVLFAVLFIYTGATKLFGIQATADFIASKVATMRSPPFEGPFLLVIFFMGSLSGPARPARPCRLPPFMPSGGL